MEEHLEVGDKVRALGQFVGETYGVIKFDGIKDDKREGTISEVEIKTQKPYVKVNFEGDIRDYHWYAPHWLTKAERSEDEIFKQSLLEGTN